MCFSSIRITSDVVATVCLVAIVCGLSGCQVAADGHNLEGVRSFRQGQYQSALQRFQQAVATDPKNADAYYNMATTLHRIGAQNGDDEMLTQAETLYNQCLDVNENHPECYRGLAVLLVETGRSDRAFKLLKNWATASPESADARIELARLYEEFGDTDTAKVHLNQAIMNDQHNPRAWAALGRIREESGDYEQALANYRRSWNLNNFQSAVADRIASLNRNTQGSVDSTLRSDTRTVTAPGQQPLR